MNKGLTIWTGQTHVNRYSLDLLRRIEEGEIDPTYIITHRAKLEDGPALYETFRDKKDGCIKVIMTALYGTIAGNRARCPSRSGLRNHIRLGRVQVSGVAEMNTMETSAKALADEYRSLGGRRMAVIDDNSGSSREWDGDQPEAAKFWKEHIATLPADDRRDVETYLPSINDDSKEPNKQSEKAP